MAPLLRRNGGDVFEDSSRSSTGGGGRASPRCSGPGSMLARVRAAARLRADAPAAGPLRGVRVPRRRSTQRLKHDFERTLNDLLIDNHIRPILALGEPQGAALALPGLPGGSRRASARRRTAGSPRPRSNRTSRRSASAIRPSATARRRARLRGRPGGARSLPPGRLRRPPLGRQGDHERVGGGPQRPVQGAAGGPQGDRRPVARRGGDADGAARLRLPALRPRARRHRPEAELAGMVRVLRPRARVLRLLEPALAAVQVAARARRPTSAAPARRSAAAGRGWT